MIQNAESEREAQRIGFKLFLSTGAHLALTLRDGCEDPEDFAQEARDLDVIIDEAVAREAGRASKQLCTIQRVIDAQLKVAMKGLADEITAVIRPSPAGC